jgi:hypothetical protein
VLYGQQEILCLFHFDKIVVFKVVLKRIFDILIRTLLLGSVIVDDGKY